MAIVTAQMIAFLLSSDARGNLVGLEGQRQGFITQLSYPILFVLGWQGVRSLGDARKMLALLVLGSVPVAGYALMRLLQLDWIVWVGGVKSEAIFSTVGGPNEFAGYVLLMIPSALLVALSSRHHVRFGVSVFTGVLMFLLILSGSRAAIFALFVVSSSFAAASLASRRGIRLAAVVTCEKGRREKLRSLCSVLVLAVGLLVITLIALGSPIRTLYQRPLSPSNAFDTTSTTRIELWATASQLVAFSPVFGYGQDSAPAAVAQIAKSVPSIKDRYADWYVSSFHNLLLDKLIDAGIIGLGSFVGMFLLLGAIVAGRFGKLEKRLKMVVAALSASLLGFVVHSLFNPVYLLNEAFFWLMAGIAYGTVRHVRPETPSSTQPALNEALEIAKEAWATRIGRTAREARLVDVLLISSAATAGILLLFFGLLGFPWPKPIGVPGPLPQPPPYPLSPVPTPFGMGHEARQLTAHLVFLLVQLAVFATGVAAMAKAGRGIALKS